MFPTTHWSVLAEATLSGDAAGRAALAQLCSDYRGPVVAFLRSRGHAPDAAEDLTQEFFLRLIESRAWKRADRARGRFRTFVLGALMHVLDHVRARDHAEKRGGGRIMPSLDELTAEGFEPRALESDAGRAFDLEWGLQLIEKVIAVIEREFAQSDRSLEFGVMKRFLPGPEPPPSYEDAAAQLGKPVTTIKTHVHRLRRRFREELRTAVGRTVSAPHEIAAEVAYLRAVLSP